MKKVRSNKGFTLVELIIVIAILAIIMLIAIPNFSGIQQRMQVRADKSTAAQIGKAVRIWITEKTSDGVNVIGSGAMADADIPATYTGDNKNKIGSANGTSNTAVDYASLYGIEDYISRTNKPTSLSNKDTGAKIAEQKYSVVLAGTDRASKIIVVVEDAATTSPVAAWSGVYNADNDATVAGNDSFEVDYTGQGAGVAYVEP